MTVALIACGNGVCQSHLVLSKTGGMVGIHEWRILEAVARHVQ
jgi:hypothetical protein